MDNNMHDQDNNIVDVDFTKKQETVEQTEITENINNEESTETVNKNSNQMMLNLMRQLKELISHLEMQWNCYRDEFKLTDPVMREIFVFNNTNRDPKPVDVNVIEDTPQPEPTEEPAEDEWDPFNGINKMTEEDVIRIFGSGHSIIAITHDITIDRIKGASSSLYAWTSSIAEYNNVSKAYMTMMEEQEAEHIKYILNKIEEETDPDKKAKLQENVDKYYNRKYLDFLRNPLSEKEVEKLIEVFNNEDKITYWIDRARTKLDQLKISNKFILEISKFETRFLDEKYHKQDNIFLLYFMQLLVYMSNVNEKNDEGRAKIMCIVIAMDRFIRNVLPPEEHQHILENVIIFEDQFIDKI